MPYNNTPIVLPEKVTGTATLPLARVKKIIQADGDIGPCSNNAAFAITIATEMFLKYVVEQAHNVVKAERKPRRNIQYRDVANAVARVENLEFLVDVVPKPVGVQQLKRRQAERKAESAKDSQTKAGAVLHGQMTLDTQLANRPKPREDAMEVDD
ncbi:histone-fold-containing protein [Piedraia hortae CBS 480.64]|uniref:Histone-fold-containing protein n=1 Tax=Piedraia hortae CBS 480.64 TaxID=1314780 RepID=A0A6A7C2X4_9PEZI|nr:histone-fold-containing protein [Piedraia hortae CBS 480.64]